jgi:hypothetical protein
MRVAIERELAKRTSIATYERDHSCSPDLADAAKPGIARTETQTPTERQPPRMGTGACQTKYVIVAGAPLPT